MALCIRDTAVNSTGNNMRPSTSEGIVEQNNRNEGGTRNKRTNVLVESFPWYEEFKEMSLRSPAFTTNIKGLVRLMRVYIGYIKSDVESCQNRPSRACKIKQNLSRVLDFFNMRYKKLKLNLMFDDSDYMDLMSQLLTMYIDISVKASRRGKESTRAIAVTIASMLFTTLQDSPDYIIDTMLKAEHIYKPRFKEFFIPTIRRVVHLPPTSGLTYIRVLLIYRIWKQVSQDNNERCRLNKLTVASLQPSPLLMDLIERGKFCNILPNLLPTNDYSSTTPSKLTRFYMTTKFDLKSSVKEFLKLINWMKVYHLRPNLEVLEYYQDDIIQPNLSIISVDDERMEDENWNTDRSINFNDQYTNISGNEFVPRPLRPSNFDSARNVISIDLTQNPNKNNSEHQENQKNDLPSNNVPVPADIEGKKPHRKVSKKNELSKTTIQYHPDTAQFLKKFQLDGLKTKISKSSSRQSNRIQVTRNITESQSAPFPNLPEANINNPAPFLVDCNHSTSEKDSYKSREDININEVQNELPTANMMETFIDTTNRTVPNTLSCKDYEKRIADDISIVNNNQEYIPIKERNSPIDEERHTNVESLSPNKVSIIDTSKLLEPSRLQNISPCITEIKEESIFLMEEPLIVIDSSSHDTIERATYSANPPVECEREESNLVIDEEVNAITEGTKGINQNINDHTPTSTNFGNVSNQKVTDRNQMNVSCILSQNNLSKATQIKPGHKSKVSTTEVRQLSHITVDERNDPPQSPLTTTADVLNSSIAGTVMDHTNVAMQDPVSLDGVRPIDVANSSNVRTVIQETNVMMQDTVSLDGVRPSDVANSSNVRTVIQETNVMMQDTVSLDGVRPGDVANSSNVRTVTQETNVMMQDTVSLDSVRPSDVANSSNVRTVIQETNVMMQDSVPLEGVRPSDVANSSNVRIVAHHTNVATLDKESLEGMRPNDVTDNSNVSAAFVDQTNIAMQHSTSLEGVRPNNEMDSNINQVLEMETLDVNRNSFSSQSQQIFFKHAQSNQLVNNRHSRYDDVIPITGPQTPSDNPITVHELTVSYIPYTIDDAANAMCAYEFDLAVAQEVEVYSAQETMDTGDQTPSPVPNHHYDLQQVSSDKPQGAFGKSSRLYHKRTVESDEQVCEKQKEFKNFYLDQKTPQSIIPIPLPNQDIPENAPRCPCNVCLKNHKTLMSNYNVLRSMQGSILKDPRKSTSPVSSLDKDLTKDHDSHLPPKKRKTITKTTPEKQELYSYTNERMMSIADVENLSATIPSNNTVYCIGRQSCLEDPINLVPSKQIATQKSTKQTKRKVTKRRKSSRDRMMNEYLSPITDYSNKSLPGGKLRNATSERDRMMFKYLKLYTNYHLQLVPVS